MSAIPVSKLLAAASVCLAAAAALSQARERPVSFAREVRPLLSDRCFKCHGPDEGSRAAGLRLDTPEGAFARRPGGAAIVPGRPELSRAFLRITEKSPARRMPPPQTHQALTSAEVETLRQWILQGARYEPHWAFVPPRAVQPPTIDLAEHARRLGKPAAERASSWLKHPVDRFVLARLHREGLAVSPRADRATLLRRVTLDLTGLPPTLAELDSFLADNSPRAYERAVERLLASPAFGERWAWEWLEAARYADTNGYQEDRVRTMWPWRDWVVRALNANLPFDQFTVEQIAGDLLPNATEQQLLATGFNRNHMLNGEGGRIPEESRVEYVADRVETTSTVWLGLTMGCARCHDHKYDPISQREFYRMYALFNNVPETGAVDAGNMAHPVMHLPTEEQRERLAALERKVRESEEQMKAASEGDPARAEARKSLEAARKAAEDFRGSLLTVMVMREQEKPRETRVLLRGDYEKPGAKVSPGVPASIAGQGAAQIQDRLALARWMVGPRNPLTARVVVNRIWMQLFGEGLVRTAEDFGLQGEPPSHPELLDWLAVSFREGIKTGGHAGKPWDVKALIRLLVTSETYKQSSRHRADLRTRDPMNRLLARAPRYRLPSFVLRDQALALSGLLVNRVGGPPVKPYQPEGVWEDFSYGKITYQQDHGEALYRRSLYTFWRRSVAPTSLFDTAARRVCTVRTERTNTPLHALTLMNDIQYAEAARAFAERALREGGASPEQRLAWMFRCATARRPTAQELAILRRGLDRAMSRYSADPGAAAARIAVGESRPASAADSVTLAAYAAVASVVLNLDETQTRE
jgi:hypothetical protein